MKNIRFYIENMNFSIYFNMKKCHFYDGISNEL